MMDGMYGMGSRDDMDQGRLVLLRGAAVEENMHALHCTALYC